MLNKGEDKRDQKRVQGIELKSILSSKAFHLLSLGDPQEVWKWCGGCKIPRDGKLTPKKQNFGQRFLWKAGGGACKEICGAAASLREDEEADKRLEKKAEEMLK